MKNESNSEYESTSTSLCDSKVNVDEKVESEVKEGELVCDSERHLSSQLFNNEENQLAGQYKAIGMELNYPIMNDEFNQSTNQNKPDDQLNIKSTHKIIKIGSKTSVDLEGVGQNGAKEPKGQTIEGNNSTIDKSLIDQECPNDISETLNSPELAALHQQIART